MHGAQFGGFLSNLVIRTMNKCVKIMQSQTSHACVLCGVRSVGDVLCPGCRADLPWLPSTHCPTCSLPTPSGTPCAACLRQPPLFTHTRAAFLYAYPLDGLIQRFKYSHALHLAPLFASALVPQVADTSAHCIVPMPLHPARLTERGFNQAVEIARPLARQLGIPVHINAAQRIRDTPAQASLGHAERLKNMNSAFICNTQVAGQHVALLDDVMTTGASLDALARAVIHAGAISVEAWVVARTPTHPS